MPTYINNLLTNKWVLNIVLIVSVFNLIGYLVIGNTQAIIFYILFACITYVFSKNMILVLGIPLVLINFVIAKNKIEGMINNTDATKDSTKDNDSTKDANKDKDKTKDTNKDKEKKEVKTDESFEVGRVKKKAGYNIDYASTVESAYDELNSILGSDGIKQLTSDTQNLMKQQMELTKSMEGMAPLIQSMAPMMKQAQSILGGMGKENNGLNGIMEMAKKFSNK